MWLLPVASCLSSWSGRGSPTALPGRRWCSCSPCVPRGASRGGGASGTHSCTTPPTKLHHTPQKKTLPPTTLYTTNNTTHHTPHYTPRTIHHPPHNNTTDYTPHHIPHTHTPPLCPAPQQYHTIHYTTHHTPHTTHHTILHTPYSTLNTTQRNYTPHHQSTPHHSAKHLCVRQPALRGVGEVCGAADTGVFLQGLAHSETAGHPEHLVVQGQQHLQEAGGRRQEAGGRR